MKQTHLRTPECYGRYEAWIETKSEPILTPIVDFGRWFITPNKFCYCGIAEQNDIIWLKRESSQPNLWEYLVLIRLKYNQLAGMKYDSMLWNFPKAQTIPGRYHEHLLKLKRC